MNACKTSQSQNKVMELFRVVLCIIPSVCVSTGDERNMQQHDLKMLATEKHHDSRYSRNTVMADSEHDNDDNA